MKLDLHTHSLLSHDGGINEREYLILQKKIDVIAITDHNEIAFAKYMNRKYGDAFIVGEEIMTQEGEVIGLYLKEKIQKRLSVEETIAEIRHQGGLVYIPHPFETVRKGISLKTLVSIISKVDIIETFNARAWYVHISKEEQSFLSKYTGAQAASSDAHCLFGAGTAYSIVDQKLSLENLDKELKTAHYKKEFAPWYSLLCPKINSFFHLFTNYEVQ